MRMMAILLLVLATLSTGCGTPPPKAMDLGALKQLRPAEPKAAKAFDEAFQKLAEGDDNAFHEVGRLAFHLDTIPALAFIADDGSEKQARLAFSGLRALIDGTASMSFERELPEGTRREDYLKTAMPVLAKPENLSRIKAGLAKLPAPGKATYGPVVEAIR